MEEEGIHDRVFVQVHYNLVSELRWDFNRLPSDVPFVCYKKVSTIEELQANELEGVGSCLESNEEEYEEEHDEEDNDENDNNVDDDDDNGGGEFNNGGSGE
ncbi:hypothetical protein GBA52_012286 [Prunus armeniaca]|nr:hypothetical protein GBA52_012286 [Prunus armeniaca]